MFLGLALRIFDTVCQGSIVGGTDDQAGDIGGLKSNLLLESGDDLLMEDGQSFFLME